MESLTVFLFRLETVATVFRLFTVALPVCVLEIVIKSGVTGSSLRCPLCDPQVVSQLSRFSLYQHHQDHRLHVCGSNMITSLEQLRNSLHELPSGSSCVCVWGCAACRMCALSLSLLRQLSLMKTHANAPGYIAPSTGYFLVAEWLHLAGEQKANQTRKYA